MDNEMEGFLTFSETAFFPFTFSPYTFSLPANYINVSWIAQ